MKSTIELAKECGAEEYKANGEVSAIYFADYIQLEAFRKSCEAEFISRCEFIGYERKGMLFNEDDISTESLYTKLYTLPKE